MSSNILMHSDSTRVGGNLHASFHFSEYIVIKEKKCLLPGEKKKRSAHNGEICFLISMKLKPEEVFIQLSGVLIATQKSICKIIYKYSKINPSIYFANIGP